MSTIKVKLSGGKIVPQSDLRAGTTLMVQNQLNILQWNAGGLTSAKKTELANKLSDNNRYLPYSRSKP